MKRLLLIPLLLAVAAAGTLAWRESRRPKLPPPPSAARLAALRAERDALQARFTAAVIEHGETSLAAAPRAGVMIGIPTSFTTSVLEQVVTGLFGETTLTLRNLRVHQQGQVQAKLLLRKRKIGEYALDVQIHRVQGLLRPGKPTVSFGQNRVEVALPVRLAGGTGEADLHLLWDSKGLAANMVCGDTDVTRPVTGTVVPAEYQVRGSFAIAASGDRVVLQPRFPDLVVRVFVDPSEQAWGVVDGVIRQQRKGCEIALNKVGLKSKLAAILGRGFNVKVPRKIFKPVGLPAGLSHSLEIQGIRLALEVKPTGVLLASDRLWYGADLAITAARQPQPADGVLPASAFPPPDAGPPGP